MARHRTRPGVRRGAAAGVRHRPRAGRRSGGDGRLLAPAEERPRMSATKTCWGVYREMAHSPGRIDDDAAIMKRVGEVMTDRGFGVELVTADAMVETPGANVFVMCERGPILDRLRAMEKTGAIVVNSPAAVRNTYRHHMVALFAQRQVKAPVSRIVATDANTPRPADC